MFRAVEDQLMLQAAGDAAGEATPASYVELRQRAVEHMRAHEPDFLPFFAQVLCPKTLSYRYIVHSHIFSNTILRSLVYQRTSCVLSAGQQLGI